jgi:hypothetical protein
VPVSSRLPVHLACLVLIGHASPAGTLSSSFVFLLMYLYSLCYVQLANLSAAEQFNDE